MSKFFTISKNQGAVFGTLLVLFFLGASYFFVYVPNNEKTVQNRHFRCLQDIDRNIYLKMTNSLSQVDDLAGTYKLQREALNKYIAGYPKNNFTLFSTELTAKEKRKSKSGDSLSSVAFYQNQKQLVAYVNKAIVSGKDTEFIKIGIQYEIEQFIKPLLPADVFDNYVVFFNDNKTNENRIVYETFPSGLSYKLKDSLLRTTGGIVSPGIRSLNVGGTAYKAFSQPVSIGSDSEFIILGLVADSSYQKEKNQLPLGVVLLLLTAAIGMIVSIPWIKLYHMGSKDKLTVTDGIASVLVSILLISLLFFVIFEYGFYFDSGNKKLTSSADTLAVRITRSFENDLDTASRLLSLFDKLKGGSISNIVNIAKNTGSISPSSTKSGDSILTNTLKNLMKPVKNIAVNQVYWLDSTGLETSNWTTDSLNAPHFNFSSRAYFKNTENHLPNRTGLHDYYIDQVVSRVSGIFTSVIAKKAVSGYNGVAAMTFTAKSVDSVVIPDGYLFAIINNQGEVLYHSLPQRNLNENLLTELADSSKLVSCLEARSDTDFNAEYYGRQYHLKIKPFTDMPYSTVIFEEKGYNDTRDTEAYVFTLSMLILLVIFMIMQIGVVFFASSQKSFFKKQLFNTLWLGPKKSAHGQYNRAITGNSAIIILLIVFSVFSSFLTYLYILLFSITLISIYLNFLFAYFYKDNGSYFYLYKFIAIKWLLLFIDFIDYFAWKTLDHTDFYYLLLFELLSSLLCYVLYRFSSILLAKIKNRMIKKGAVNKTQNISYTYTHSFALMATTRLIITSGIPVAFFFIFSFNYEQNIETRHRQLDFARALKPKVSLSDINYTTDKQHRIDSLSINGIYNDGVFVNNFEIDTCGKNLLLANIDFPCKIIETENLHSYKHNAGIAYDNESYFTVRLLSAFRLLMNDIELKSENTNFPSIDNEAFFNDITREKAGKSFASFTYYKISDSKFIKLSSTRINYPLKHSFLLLLLFLALAITVFYFIIHSVIRKLFALNLPSVEGWNKMDKDIILDDELNKLLLIVGAPGSGKLEKLKNAISGGKLYGNSKKKKDEAVIDKKLLIYDDVNPENNNVFIADMILISAEKGEDDLDWKRHKNEALKEKYALVIINHFEYNIKDVNTSRIKLDLLEAIMQKDRSKIIIISSVHPVTFLDSFNEQQTNPIPESELERWQVLLGHFRIIIEPLVKNEDNSYSNNQLKKNISEETAYTPYLIGMKTIAMETALTVFNQENEEISPLSDSMILKLQITSHYFYTYMWQSLTKEEKFLLYDLAEDGLVNSYDDFNLNMLISKGLVINPDGTLMLFNKGFRNFILTAIGNTEVNRIKNQVTDNGNWGSLKTPLTIIILAILIFLIASQQEAYTHLITYITALGAGIPAVLKIFSMFGNNDAQKTS